MSIREDRSGGCVQMVGRWGAGDLLLYAPAVVVVAATAADRSPESADGNARAESALSGK